MFIIISQSTSILLPMYVSRRKADYSYTSATVLKSNFFLLIIVFISHILFIIIYKLCFFLLKLLLHNWIIWLHEHGRVYMLPVHYIIVSIVMYWYAINFSIIIVLQKKKPRINRHSALIISTTSRYHCKHHATTCWKFTFDIILSIPKT